MDESLTLLTELAGDFEGELIGLSEFAKLAGLDKTRAVQLRTDRKRGATGFPAVVSESGRSYLHRLDDLVEWIGSSRHRDLVAPDQSRVAVWRLTQRMRSVVETVGVVRARRLLAGLGIVGRSNSGEEFRADPLDAVSRSGDELAVELVGSRRGVALVARQIAAELSRPSCDEAVVDEVLVALGEHQPGVSHRSATALALLLAIVLDAGPGDVVHEPTCGECETLLQVSRLATARSETVGEISGSDHSPEAVLVGRARLSLADVDATIGQTAAPGSVDRLILDPGDRDNGDQVAQWAKLLSAEGRAVLVTGVGEELSSLLVDLPPSAVVIPPQSLVPSGPGTTVVWVADRRTPGRATCRLIDLRPASTQEQHDPNQLRVLTDAVGVRRIDKLGAVSQWSEELKTAVPDLVRVHDIELADFDQQLRRGIEGTLGVSAVTIAENRHYALALARELNRLIGGRQVPAAGLSTTPTDSPDGVLAPLTTDEARRVVARLVDSLSGRRGNRRPPEPSNEAT